MLSVAFGSSHPHTVASAIACYTMLIKERKKAFETSTLVSLAGLVTLSLSAQSADIIREAFKLLGVLLPALGPTDGDPLLPQALAAIGNGAGAVRSERRAFLKKIIKRFGYVVFIFILFCFIFYAGLLFMIFFFIFYLVFLFYLLYGQCFFVIFFFWYICVYWNYVVNRVDRVSELIPEEYRKLVKNIRKELDKEKNPEKKEEKKSKKSQKVDEYDSEEEEELITGKKVLCLFVCLFVCLLLISFHFCIEIKLFKHECITLHNNKLSFIWFLFIFCSISSINITLYV